MSAPAWRAGLRIARREAWRNKGRSLLVIALIGFPVLVLAVADVAYRTWQLGPQEKLTRTLGSADAVVQWAGGTVDQDPRSYSDYTADVPLSQASGTPTTPPSSALQARLPAGSRVIQWREGFGGVDSARGRSYARIDGLDYADPMTTGLVKPTGGRAPRTTGEIALTTTLAGNLGLRLGDTVHLANPDSTFRIVGLVNDVNKRRESAAYLLPAALPPTSDRFYVQDRWLVDSPTELGWADVRALNKAGYAALSRQVYLHPPPDSEVTYHAYRAGNVSAKAAATASLIGGMALLEIVLLAGPAFAVSARRQRRDLALVAAVGGRREDLRNVVLSKGIVLGLAGGLLSAVVAVGVAAIGIPTVGHRVNEIPGHFDVRPFELLALTVVSLLAALAAAVFPARGASRTDVVAALAGRRGTVRTRKRVPLFGASVAGVGVVVALGGLGASANSLVILAGVALTEIGLIICLPALLGLVSRVGRWLPLSPRIALRDAGRNRSSAAPAIAAVMAAVIGCVAALIGVASANDQDRRSYQPSLPMNKAYVSLPYGHRPDLAPAQVVAAVRSNLPGARPIPITTPGGGCSDGNACDQSSVNPTGDLHYLGYVPPVVVDDGTALEALMQAKAPAAVAALRAGKVVVNDPALVHDGRVEVTVTNSGNLGQTLHLPAVVAGDQAHFVPFVVPPSLMTRLHLKTSVEAVYVDTAHPPTTRERQAADAALAKLDPDLRLDVETGFHSSRLAIMLGLVIAAAVIAIGATMIATALSNVDSRPDLTTLASVGAAPRTRRALSMSRAGVIATIGTALGAAAGFVPSIAWLHSQSFTVPFVGSAGNVAKLRLVVPWLPFALVVLAVPITAMLIAGLLSRSRLPSERAAE